MAKEASSNTVCLLLLNLLVSSIAARPSKDEAADAKITTLPGQPMDASFAQYSGYVTINEKKKLFYWLVEASSDAESKPLLLWLNGGPGASTIGYGAFQEIGPFQILPDGKLSKRQFAWNTGNFVSARLRVLKLDKDSFIECLEWLLPYVSCCLFLLMRESQTQENF